MNDFIQTIQVLEENELKLVNNHINTLQFSESLVFDTQKKLKIDFKELDSYTKLKQGYKILYKVDKKYFP